MNHEIVDLLIEKVKSCEDEDLLDLILKLFLECGY